MGYWVGSDFLRADVETRTKGTVRIRVWSAGNDDVATRAEGTNTNTDPGTYADVGTCILACDD